jgi:2-phosphosulfolactate phosphatase
VHDGQTQYQVRFDWGVAGARAVGEGVDAIVLVDVLPEVLREPRQPAVEGPTVIRGNLRNRAAVAQWALAAQGDKGDRFMIAVVAAGEPRNDGSIRFAVEDLLGAGAIIDALGDVGIDYCSPEAAAASAAYTGLKNATGHLIGASASGRALAADGRRSEIDHAIARDAADPIGE